MKQFSKKVKNSIIFWNILAAIMLGVWFIVDREVFLFLEIAISGLTFAHLITADWDDDPLNNQYWMFLSPVIWVLLWVGCVVWVLMKVYMGINKFLDK